MLCDNSASQYTAEETVANWQLSELPVQYGYQRFSAVVGSGSYDAANGYYTLPQVSATFNCTDSQYTFDTVVLYFGASVYPHSIIVENPLISLLAGQTRTYNLTLIQDD